MYVDIYMVNYIWYMYVYMVNYIWYIYYTNSPRYHIHKTSDALQKHSDIKGTKHQRAHQRASNLEIKSVLKSII